jgi:hypothetical protein
MLEEPAAFIVRVEAWDMLLHIHCMAVASYVSNWTCYGCGFGSIMTKNFWSFDCNLLIEMWHWCVTDWYGGAQLSHWYGSAQLSHLWLVLSYVKIKNSWKNKSPKQYDCIFRNFRQIMQFISLLIFTEKEFSHSIWCCRGYVKNLVCERLLVWVSWLMFLGVVTEFLF